MVRLRFNGVWCMVVRFTGSKFELCSKHMPLYALGNSGKAYRFYLRPLILCCVLHCFCTLATTLETVPNTLKYTKMTPNTKRLALTGDLLNESITVNKSSHLLSKLKRKEKKLILLTVQTTVNNCAPKYYITPINVLP